MFPLMWATLLFSVTGSSTGRDAKEQPSQNKGEITLSKAQITAEAGLCVAIPCSFTARSGFTPQHIVWYKCEKSCRSSDIIYNSNKLNNQVQSGFRGRVSLLEPDVSQRNCSIIIKDLTESDSGLYQLRVNGHQTGGINYSKLYNTSTIHVTALSQKPTVVVPPLTEGQQTTLTCTAPGLCSGSAPTITWTWSEAGENDSHITGNITEDLTAVTQRHSSTLTLNPSAEHHGTNITCKVEFTNSITTEDTVTLNVTYVKKPAITGNTTVEKGAALNLTCSLESFPPPVITWTKHGSNKSLQNENVNTTQRNTGHLVVLNVTEEYSGSYICSAEHQSTVQTARADVTVTFLPRVLKSSGCVAQSEVVTCVCVSEGVPLPTVEWPLLKTHTEYSVTTKVFDHTVNSSVTVKHRNYTTLRCVSSNKVGVSEMNISVTGEEFEQDDLLEILLQTPNLPQVIVVFLTGILLSATICCLATKCHRNKKKNSGNMPETPGECLEMISQAVENDDTHDREAAEGGAEAAGQSAPDGDVQPREVEYSNIDFSMMKRKNSTGAEDAQETTETEYAEIKTKETEERRDQSGEDGDILEGNEEKMEEIKQCTSAEEEGGEDVGVYSTVEEIMDEI